VSRRVPRESPPANQLAERFRAEVVSRGQFEHDWFTVHIPQWSRLLAPLEGQGARLLELGSFEGMSACFLLWRLPDAHLTCVESFDGWLATPELEGRFDRNVALIDKARVRKLAGKTRDMLPRLLDEGQRFDFVYVDASHHALDVLGDAALSWQLLELGGLILFDDYGLDHGDPLLTPTIAVDAFFGVVASQAEQVPAGGQFALRRLR
jgi:predicted O-methyltransferase YrrM